MSKIPFLLVCVGFLAACTDGGTPSTGHMLRPDGTPGERPFVDETRNNNKNVTNMIVTKESQAITAVSRGLSGYAGPKDSTKYEDVAELAVQIASGTATEPNFSDEAVWKPALYVVSPGLYKDCAGNDDIAGCIKAWRTEYETIAAQRLNTMLENFDVIDISDASFQSTANTELKFTVDKDGNIDSISVGDTEYVRDGMGNIFTNGNKKLEYVTGAPRDDKLKLSYSDFGMYYVTENGNRGRGIPFAGGYASRKINDITKIETDVRFTGNAVGVVYDADSSMNLRDGTATLVFNKDKATLTADFSNWYDVTVTKDSSGTTDIKFNKSLNEAFDFKPNSETPGSANMNVGYYGPAGTPTEATGTVTYRETDGINMDMAFGVK